MNHRNKPDNFGQSTGRRRSSNLERLHPAVRIGVYAMALVLFVMFVGGGLRLGSSRNTKNNVARVFSQDLGVQQYTMLYQRLRNNQEAMRRKGMFLTKEDMETRALRDGISDLLVAHALDSLHVQVSDEEVEKMVQAQLQFLPDQFFLQDGSLNTRMFEQALGGMKFSDFVADVERSIGQQFMSGLLDSTSYVSDLEVLLQYNQEYAKKEFDVLEIALSDILAEVKKEGVTDAQLKKFYASSPKVKRLQNSEKRSGIMWTFKADDYGITLTEKQERMYYKKHKDRYIDKPGYVKVERIFVQDEHADALKTQDIKKQLQEVRESVAKNPDSFAELSRKITKSSPKVATYEDNDKKIDPVIKKVISGFSKKGDLSDVVKTKDGYELLRCVERVSPTHKTFEQARKQIQETLTREKFNKRFEQDARRLSSTVAHDPEALQTFVKKHKGSGTRLTKLPMINEDIRTLYLFSLAGEGKMKYYFNEHNQGILMQCLEIFPANMPKLEDVSKAVEEIYYQDKAEKILAERSKQAAQYTQNHSLEKAAEKFGGKVTSVTKEYKDGKIQQPALLRGSNVAKKVQVLQNKGMVTYATTRDKGLVLQLTNTPEVDEKLLEQKRPDIKKQILQQRHVEKRNDFIAALYRRGKLRKEVTINDTILPKHLKDA